jgi:hypothetical protein
MKPRALKPDDLAKFVRDELARIERYVAIALSPDDYSLEERRDAIAAIRGHERRLGSMLLTSPERKAATTAAGRSKAAKKHEPQQERMSKLIAEAEGIYSPGRGQKTRIDSHVAEKMNVDEKTVSRHRKKMRTL